MNNSPVLLKETLAGQIIEKLDAICLLCESATLQIVSYSKFWDDYLSKKNNTNLTLNSIFSEAEIHELIKGGTLRTIIGAKIIQFNLTKIETDNLYFVYGQDVSVEESLHKQNQELKLVNSELQELYDQIGDDAIFITDKDGNVEYYNSVIIDNCNVNYDFFIGKNVWDLEKKGLYTPYVTTRVIKSKQIESIVYDSFNFNRQMHFGIGVPIFDKSGELEKVVCVSRDCTKLVEYAISLTSKNELLNKKDGSNRQIVTHNSNMLNVLTLTNIAANNDSTVLILGETGTGKGLVASLIHENGERKDKPFITINCGAISPAIIESELFGYEGGSFTGARKEGKIGLIEAANGGTVFLDEISELPIEQQVKLLHTIQDKTLTKVGGTKEISLDVRFIAATNKDLKKLIEQEKFREDLYYRLSVFPIKLPPLRERKEDIELLGNYFLKKFNDKYDKSVIIPKDIYNIFSNYSWPGNVREFENCIERLVIKARNSLVDETMIESEMDDMNTSARINNLETTVPLEPSGNLYETLADVEKRLIKEAIDTTRTEKEAAEYLGISQSTISKKKRQYQL